MSSSTLPLVLASSSRYRRALLERLRLPFVCVSPEVDERAFAARITDPVALALVLSEAKAEAVARAHPEAIVIGSDQVAALGDRILEKPGTHPLAVEQLRALRGREHALHTGLALVVPERGVVSDVISVRLTMNPLTDDAIERYLRADEPYDCCGSYRIESLGIALFSAVATEDFTAIEGLPLLTLARRLREAGLRLP